MLPNATSRVKTNLFLTFEIAARWQNVCYTRQYYSLDSLNQTINTKLHNTSEVDSTSKSTSFIKLLHF